MSEVFRDPNEEIPSSIPATNVVFHYSANRGLFRKFQNTSGAKPNPSVYPHDLIPDAANLLWYGDSVIRLDVAPTASDYGRATQSFDRLGGNNGVNEFNWWKPTQADAWDPVPFSADANVPTAASSLQGAVRWRQSGDTAANFVYADGHASTVKRGELKNVNARAESP